MYLELTAHEYMYMYVQTKLKRTHMIQSQLRKDVY